MPTPPAPATLQAQRRQSGSSFSTHFSGLAYLRFGFRASCALGPSLYTTFRPLRVLSFPGFHSWGYVLGIGCTDRVLYKVFFWYARFSCLLVRGCDEMLIKRD